MRTPELLVEAAASWPEAVNRLAAGRPALRAASGGDIEKVTGLLEAEEREERQKDREYWAPLKRELERFRQERKEKPAQDE